MWAEAVLLVITNRLTQRTGISRFVLASILLITWKLKDIRQLPSVTLHMMTDEHVFTGERTSALWDNTCLLPCYCPLLEMLSHSRATGRDVWMLIQGFRAQSACWVQVALASSGKDVWARLGAALGQVIPTASKQLRLLSLGSLLFPLLERFSAWLLAIYKFLLMLKTLVRDMWLHAFSRQKCQQNYPQAPVRASVWLFLIPLTKRCCWV